MSIDENTTDAQTEDNTDLDEFSNEFFQQSDDDAPKNEEEEAPTPEETEDEVDESEDEEVIEEEDTLATEEDDNNSEEEEDEGSEPESEPKKKNRFQERIDELTAGRREAEREAAELRKRLDALEARQNTEASETSTQTQETESTLKAPSPDDKNEDGTDKYPLGEFDPNYITDMVDYRFEVRSAEERKAQAQSAEEAEVSKARQALEDNWNERLDSARERYPDLDEKGEALVSVFEGIEPSYGEYLSAALMGMDHGPDVLYYLANHPDEADAIVKSGPMKATVALGRIESRFVETQEERTKGRPKVSKAPTPPPVNKGSSVAKGRVAPDTDDLEAFEKTFFKK